jgi:hypothetical protein
MLVLFKDSVTASFYNTLPSLNSNYPNSLILLDSNFEVPFSLKKIAIPLDNMSSYSSDRVKRRGRRSLLPIAWFRQKSHPNKRSTQTQSIFFSKLHPELRTQVYRWAYSHINPIIHITRSWAEDKLVHFPCIATDPQDSSNWQPDLGHYIEEWGVQHQICHEALLARLRHGSHDGPEAKPERTTSPFLAIMLTCHLMFVLIS